MSGPTPFGRRRLLQLLGGAGVAVLAGCRGSGSIPRLSTSAGTLPKPWLQSLPKPWQTLVLKPGDPDIASGQASRDRADLLALTDGWLATVPDDELQPIGSGPLSSRLDNVANLFLKGLGPSRASRVLPVGVSPWVMLFRHGEDLVAAGQRSWDVLLSPELQGRVVLPASPRLVMDLANQMEVPDALRRLRQQVLSFDDRQGINWLLKDRAGVVVLPLQRCMSFLRRDPRLRAALPERGAPLHWTVLVRPDGTREPLPRSWVESAWEQPLLMRLLAMGWRAPVKQPAPMKLRSRLPSRWSSLLLPSPEIWSRCWSLAPLNPKQQARLVEQWMASSP